MPTSVGELKAEWLQQGRSLWQLPVLEKAEEGPATDPAAVEQGSELTSVANIGRWSKLAFQSARTGNWEIFVARGDGGEPRQLTFHPAGDFSPQLNRGTTHLVFVSNRDSAIGETDLFSLAVDGSQLRQLTDTLENEADPQWSPDGSRIVFSRRVGNDWELFMMGADGSNPQRLTFEPNYWDISPAWSPSGDQIVWARWDRDGYATIEIMNADGSNQRRLTTGCRWLQNLRWHPEGKLIGCDCDANGDFFNEVRIYHFEYGYWWGSGVSPSDWTDLWMDSWAPDGNAFTFTRVVYTVENNQLYIVSIQVGRVNYSYGSATEPVYLGPGPDAASSWQSTDAVRPSSRVMPLPTYSQGGETGLIVAWAASDVGGSGLKMTTVEMRAGTSGPWRVIGNRDSAPFWASTYAHPGQTLYFRSQALDNALNREPWPDGDWDASTTVYRWELNGQVTDARGRPLPRPSMVVSPAPLNPLAPERSGYYRAFYAENAAVQLSASRRGYGAWPPTTVNLESDRTLDLALPPLDNVVRNGGFEESPQTLVGWQTGGVTAATPRADAALSGALGAQVGQRLVAPAFARLTTGDQGDQMETKADAVFDADGTLHVTWTEKHSSDTFFVESRVLYTTCPLSAACQPAQQVADGHAPAVAVGPGGVVHLVWYKSQYPDRYLLYYASRAPNGSWSSPQLLATLGPENYWPVLQYGLELAVAPDGRVHLWWWQNVQSDWTSLIVPFYAWKPASGGWSAPERVPHLRHPSAMALGPDGSVYVAGWKNYDFVLLAKPVGASWQPPEPISLPPGYELSSPEKLLSDAEGNLYLVLTRFYASGMVLARNPSGQWRELGEFLYGSHKLFDLALGVNNRIVAVMSARSGVMLAYYAPESGSWSAPQPFEGLGLVDGAWLAIRPNTNTVALMVQAYPSASPFARRLHLARFAFRPERRGQSTLSQALTIPAAMHAPTLSLRYTYQTQDEPGKDWLLVTVRDREGAREVLRTDEPAGRRLFWVDMQPWSGQTITVTVAISATANGHYSWAYLDEVSLGSWLTPVVEGVSPWPLPARQATRVTVRGDNFLPGARVRLGNTQLGGVTWLDAQTLQADLPAGLAPGLYDLWVVNPDGQAAMLPNGLRVGWAAWLPMVSTYRSPTRP
ncbi:MAG: IPT/TIG domain-containing protein [Anaerolineae bacterium]|nr:IPT/TIG domain-containing protein [Anaerolineae bacterium]